MDLQIEMIDKQTGEVLAKKCRDYALNFAVKNDSGFAYLHRWLESCVRGVRCSEHRQIQLRIDFSEYKPTISNGQELGFY